jgi:hypothetical protein
MRWGAAIDHQAIRRKPTHTRGSVRRFAPSAPYLGLKAEACGAAWVIGYFRNYADPALAKKDFRFGMVCSVLGAQCSVLSAHLLVCSSKVI